MKKMKNGNNRIFMLARNFIVQDIIIPRTSIPIGGAEGDPGWRQRIVSVK
jgi:hypothetical protein